MGNQARIRAAERQQKADAVNDFTDKTFAAANWVAGIPIILSAPTGSYLSVSSSTASAPGEKAYTFTQVKAQDFASAVESAVGTVRVLQQTNQATALEFITAVVDRLGVQGVTFTGEPGYNANTNVAVQSAASEHTGVTEGGSVETVSALLFELGRTLRHVPHVAGVVAKNEYGRIQVLALMPESDAFGYRAAYQAWMDFEEQHQGQLETEFDVAFESRDQLEDYRLKGYVELA